MLVLHRASYKAAFELALSVPQSEDGGANLEALTLGQLINVLLQGKNSLNISDLRSVATVTLFEDSLSQLV